jgi:hypothetical protein
MNSCTGCAGKGPLITTDVDLYREGQSHLRIALFGLMPIGWRLGTKRYLEVVRTSLERARHW